MLTVMLARNELLCALGLTLLISRHAKGLEPLECSHSGNWVRVTVQGPGSAALAKPLLDRLRAELAPHQIAVCSEAGTGQPLADIRIVGASQQLVGIEVRIDDAVTKKQIARSLDLRALPPDAHVLTIALGAAELLRASWAEIRIHREKAQESEVPQSVRDTVDESLERPTPSGAFALHLAAEGFSKGLRQVGADVAGRVNVAGPFSLTLRLGARQAASARTEDGLIRANAWIIGTGGLLRVTPPHARAVVGLTAHLDCVREQFFAEPIAGASATTLSGIGYLGSVGVFGGIPLGLSMHIDAEIDAGVVIKGVSARDGERVAVAMNGRWVGGALGLSFGNW